MPMSGQLYPSPATHTNSLCLPLKGWWRQSNFLLMWMLYFSPLLLSLIFIASHGFPSPADIWSHKRYICCYNHWHPLASGHQLCQSWLFLLGGGVNATGTAAAQNQWLWACCMFRLQPNLGVHPMSSLCCLWPSWPSKSHALSSQLLSTPAKYYDPVHHDWTSWQYVPEINGQLWWCRAEELYEH